MIQKKNGTPTNAVMMPIGKSPPGFITLESTEAIDKNAAPTKIVVGRKNL